MLLTEEKGDGVEYVSQYKLHGESVNAETTTDPRQKAVDSSDQRQDGQYVGPDDGVLADMDILNLPMTHKIWPATMRPNNAP